MMSDEENQKFMRRGLRYLVSDAMASVRHIVSQVGGARTLGMAIPPDLEAIEQQAKTAEQQLKAMFESIKAN